MNLDTTKPWRSQAEYLDAMHATNSRGQRRYEVDEAYRNDVAAKLDLGFENSDGPSVSSDGNVIADSVKGSRPNYQRINLTERDQFEAQESVRLQSEIKEAEDQLAQLAPAADQEQCDKALDASVELIKRGGIPRPFADAAEMTRAMSDPRYRRDPDFNAAVAARAALGVPGVTGIVSDDSQSQQA